MDLDPGSPKTYVSGSPTMLMFLLFYGLEKSSISQVIHCVMVVSFCQIILTMKWATKNLCAVYSMHYTFSFFQSRKRPFKHHSTKAYLSCGLFRCHSRRLLFNFNALPRKYRREYVRRFAGIQVRYVLLFRWLSLAGDWSELRRRALSCCWAGQFNDDCFQSRLWFEAAKERAGRLCRVSSGELVVLCFNRTLKKRLFVCITL